MGESSTSAAMCKVCGHRHRMMDAHLWGVEPKKAGVIKGLKTSMANMANKPMANKKDMANGMANDPVLSDPVFIARVNERYDDLAKAGHVEPDDLKATYKYRDAEKRRAYQREYMRKRRAETGGK